MARFFIPDSELDIQFACSGGPGGQNVNKVASKAVLKFSIATSPSIPDDVRERFMARYANKVNGDGDVVIHASQHRDQPKNKAEAIRKLHELLDSVADAPIERVATEPTKAQKARRLDSKKKESQRKANRRFKPTDW